MDDKKISDAEMARAAYNAYMRDYRARNKERIKEINKRYYIKKYKENEDHGRKQSEI